MDIHIKTVTRARTDGRTDGRGHSHERAPDARCDKMSTSTRCARDVLPDALSLSLSRQFLFLVHTLHTCIPTYLSLAAARSASSCACTMLDSTDAEEAGSGGVGIFAAIAMFFRIFFSLFLCRSSRATLNELNEYARMNTSVNRIAD